MSHSVRHDDFHRMTAGNWRLADVADYIEEVLARGEPEPERLDLSAHVEALRERYCSPEE